MSEGHRSAMGPTSCQLRKEDAGPCIRPRPLSAQLSVHFLLQRAGDYRRPVKCAAIAGLSFRPQAVAADLTQVTAAAIACASNPC